MSHRGKQRGGSAASSKLRGNPKRDSDAVQMSKTLSWILRHGAHSEGLAMREDGCVRVAELLKLPKMSSITMEALEQMVKDDSKMRFSLLSELDTSSQSKENVWWIKANQGHSLKSVVDLSLKPITEASQVPMAVHGTNLKAWKLISTQGLSKMTRNHIHFAQGVAGSGVISGMRSSSQVLIYINLEKALSSGLKFSISDNGVVLTEGDERGFVKPEYFEKVERANGQRITGWEPDITMHEDAIGVEEVVRTDLTLPSSSAEGSVSKTTTQP